MSEDNNSNNNNNNNNNIKKSHKLIKFLEDRNKLITLICVVVVAISTVYVAFFSNTPPIIIDNSQNQDPFLDSNLTAYYTVEREDETEKYTVSVTNIGSNRIDDLTIHITFPENMTIYDKERFSGQRIKGEDGGEDFSYYNVLYYWIYVNETIDVTLYLNNNNDENFVSNEEIKIIPETLIYYENVKISPVIKNT